MKNRLVRSVVAVVMCAVAIGCGGCQSLQQSGRLSHAIGQPATLVPQLAEPAGLEPPNDEARPQRERGVASSTAKGSSLRVASRFEDAQFDRPFVRLAGTTIAPRGNGQHETTTLRGQSLDVPGHSLYETPMEFSADPFCLSGPAGVDPTIPFADLLVDIQSDHYFFYSRENVRPALAFLGVSAAMAYSNWDGRLLDFTQTALPSTADSGLFRAFRTVGNGYAMLPVYAGSALVGKYLQLGGPRMATIGEWGDRTFRGILVGTPPLLVAQYALGSSRPDESAHDSRWDFFEDTNGVSGHAFMGAVPFLTAYQMAETTRSKIFWLSLSMIPAVSRIADNAHYPSQSLLGWGLACLATSSVARTELGHCTFVMVPSVDGRQCGMTLMIRR